MSGCEEVLEILVATARGETVSAPGQTFLREHVENCAQCRSRLANERVLSAGLRAVSSTVASVPPPSMKAALLKEFRNQQVVVPIRKPVVRWVAMAAVAAGLLIAALLLNGGRTAPVVEPVKTPVAVAPAPVAPPVARREPPVAPVVVSEKKIAGVRKASPRRRAPVVPAHSVKAEEPTEVATDFFEIPYAEPLRPEERADVFRVQMPRANMAVFGLPVSGGRLDSRITADVLTGEDGVVRAVRFIR